MYIFNSAVLTTTKITFLLFFVFLVVNSVSGGKRFNLQRYCRSQCTIGQGGNLCRCNAFHFAGKRADFVSHGLRTSSENLSGSKGLPLGAVSGKYPDGTPTGQLEISADQDDIDVTDALRPDEMTGQEERVRAATAKSVALLEKLISLIRKQRTVHA